MCARTQTLPFIRWQNKNQVNQVNESRVDSISFLFLLLLLVVMSLCNRHSFEIDVCRTGDSHKWIGDCLTLERKWPSRMHNGSGYMTHFACTHAAIVVNPNTPHQVECAMSFLVEQSQFANDTFCIWHEEQFQSDTHRAQYTRSHSMTHVPWWWGKYVHHKKCKCLLFNTFVFSAHLTFHRSSGTLVERRKEESFIILWYFFFLCLIQSCQMASEWNEQWLLWSFRLSGQRSSLIHTHRSPLFGRTQIENHKIWFFFSFFLSAIYIVTTH